MGMGRKTKTRVENLIAWILAVAIIALLAAGVYFALLQFGVV